MYTTDQKFGDSNIIYLLNINSWIIQGWIKQVTKYFSFK